MNVQKDKYIIVEIIPTYSTPEKGFIAQLSALKLEGIKLIDRFDYRVQNRLISNPDIRRMISYDRDSFQYVNNTNFILEKFRQWSRGYPLLLLDDELTPRYLASLENPKELAYPHLGMQFSLDIFDRIMQKYPIQPTPHLVDVIYEAIIYEGNQKVKKKH